MVDSYKKHGYLSGAEINHFKNLSNVNKRLESDINNLNSKCEYLEFIINKDFTEQIKVLFKELNVCINELSDLVTNYVNINEQKV